MKYFLILLPIAAVIFIGLSVLKNGFKGSLFGGRIIQTHGKLKLKRKGMKDGSIEIHTIENSGSKFVGLAVCNSSILGKDISPVTMDTNEVEELVDILKKSIENNQNKAVERNAEVAPLPQHPSH